MDLHKEVNAKPPSAELTKHEAHRELYAIINTLQCLEMAFIQNYVQDDEYTNMCNKLLSTCKSLYYGVEGEFPSVEEFAAYYKMDCRIALNRIKEDRPMVIKNSTRTLYMDCTVSALDLLNKLELENITVDGIALPLEELYDLLCKLDVPQNCAGKEKLGQWIEKFKTMKGCDQISNLDVRNLLFDIKVIYKDIYKGP